MKKLDLHKVSLIRIKAIKLKTKTAKSQTSDLSFNLKQIILTNTNLKWLNTNDFALANEFNFDAKIDKVYFRRCMKKIVVLYDLKNKHCREIKQLRENRNVFSIGVENALEGVCQKKRATFAKSKWIGIVDSRGNRSMAKKFPLLNSALFTKQTPVPECEIQGQTLLEKFTTNEYHSTDKTHKDATELYKTIMRPFSNYR